MEIAKEDGDKMSFKVLIKLPLFSLKIFTFTRALILMEWTGCTYINPEGTVGFENRQ